jgi:probable HAF family extracellular repeat protein
MRLTASSIVVLALSLLSPGVTSAAASVAATEHIYTIGGLPSEAAFPFVSPSGLNDQGDVVGLLAGTARSTQAARMDGAGWRSLGDGEASDINRVGQVVGFLNIDTPLGSLPHATAWDSRGVPRDLGTLSDGAWSQAVAINDRGWIAGYAQARTLTHAFVWRDAQGMRDLGSLGSGSSYAFAINSSGDVAGSADGQAVLWDAGGHVRILGAGAASLAYAMNDSGLVVGGAGDRGFSWQARSGVTLLGSMAGTSSSTAVATNDLGQIVGSAAVSDSSGLPAFRAVIWQHEQMTDLNSLVDAGTGWQLTRATAINNRGQIVGSGTYHGQARAFMLTPGRGHRQ